VTITKIKNISIKNTKLKNCYYKLKEYLSTSSFADGSLSTSDANNQFAIFLQHSEYIPIAQSNKKFQFKRNPH